MHRDPAAYGPDDHAVEPESGQEMIDGKIIQVSPALHPHADRQCDINYVLRGNVAEGYISSTELLTRVDEDQDFATDACIRKDGFDGNGDRYLEELSFEVKHTQSEASLKQRARNLVRRGVRRVFAIHVEMVAAEVPDAEGAAGVEAVGQGEGDGKAIIIKAGPVTEWSVDVDDWLVLDNDGFIEDRCLLAPIRVRAFIDAFEADNAVARALVEQENPVIVEVQTTSYDDGYDAGKSEGYDAGKSDGVCMGLREAIRTLCPGLGIELGGERSAQLDALDLEDLRDLMRHLQEHRDWPSAAG